MFGKLAALSVILVGTELSIQILERGIRHPAYPSALYALPATTVFGGSVLWMAHEMVRGHPAWMLAIGGALLIPIQSKNKLF